MYSCCRRVAIWNMFVGFVCFWLYTTSFLASQRDHKRKQNVVVVSLPILDWKSRDIDFCGFIEVGILWWVLCGVDIRGSSMFHESIAIGQCNRICFAVSVSELHWGQRLELVRRMWLSSWRVGKPSLSAFHKKSCTFSGQGSVHRNLVGGGWWVVLQLVWNVS